MNTSARYFTLPPTNVPEFFFRHYVWTWRNLIAWSVKEYDDALILFSKRGAMKTVKYLSKEYSAMRVLAEMPGFRRMIANITQDVWDKFDMRERVFIRRAWEIYELLRKSKLQA